MGWGGKYGECSYTDHYSDITKTQNGSFTGSLNTGTGSFSATVINTQSYATSGENAQTHTYGSK